MHLSGQLPRSRNCEFSIAEFSNHSITQSSGAFQPLWLADFDQSYATQIAATCIIFWYILTALKAESKANTPGSHALMNDLPSLLNAAPPRSVAVVVPETGTAVTYESLRRQVNAMAEALAAIGIRRGEYR